MEKILHICLNSPLTDRWNYQDNLLPKYHKINGNNVVILTSSYTRNIQGEIVYDNRKAYYNENDIKVIRLRNKYYTNFKSKFKKYKDVYENIKNECPTIIFVHGPQFVDIKQVIKYVKEHTEVKILVDNHADFSNSASNWVSRNILHKIIWRYYSNLIEPFTHKFYGVLPARVEFLKNIYKLPSEKVELLVMGADDENIKEARDETSIKFIRNKYNIKTKDFLIMTGGKIDQAKKQTLLLMQAVKNIDRKDVKLIVFGSVVEELQNKVNELADGVKVQYIGWVKAEENLKYFASADLVVFPGRHSVFWEQVVALGIPLMVKRWPGTSHIDIGGNCVFLKKDDVSEMYDKIYDLVNNPCKYKKLQTSALDKRRNEFLYSEIAKRSLD